MRKRREADLVFSASSLLHRSVTSLACQSVSGFCSPVSVVAAARGMRLLGRRAIRTLGTVATVEAGATLEVVGWWSVF